MTRSDDSKERGRALDPSRSFIVEAPAGSGKTELLIQRYLRLLDCVDTPEQVVAITFTRKAAAEMRHRVIELLTAAAGDEPMPEHRKTSKELAHRVLVQSAKRGWSLREHPQRLRITTIDALNASLAQQLPISSGGIIGAAVDESPDRLYRIAAERTAECLDDDGELGLGLRKLLGAVDNSRTKLEQWLAGALPQRDRWLRSLNASDAAHWPEAVQSALVALAAEHVNRVRQTAGQAAERCLLALLERRGPVTDLEAAWRAGAALLLTKNGQWRRRMTRRDGIETDADRA
ncbi:MAG: UvrD-helicase domain-containing protein, partial [Gammaproteobacteria bacterium]|nr:UvrD-helicase domain-containing protein [Gammaproteobacteria bacterium]